MKTHALKSDGTTVCGMNAAAGHQIAVGSAAEIPEEVTCGSCRRLLVRSVAAAEETSAAAAPPSTGDEALRALVREEISLGIEQLLRVREAADVLAVSKKVVRRLVESGELAVVKVDRKKRRITASSVEAYIRRNTA